MFSKNFKKTESSPLLKAPFYACPVYTKLNCIQCGIAITTKAEALDLDNKVIPGLYVCGEAVSVFDEPLVCLMIAKHK